MSTFMPKAGEIDRKWYVIDAAGKPVGRLHLYAGAEHRHEAQKPETWAM